MNIVLNLILAVQLLTALAMIGLILVQHGKGADMGAAFGSGGSGSLFGASGSANFLSRTTAVLAAVFFVCTLALAYFGNLRPGGGDGNSVLERVGITAPAPAPVTPLAPTGPAAQIPGNAGAPATLETLPKNPARSGDSVPAATGPAAVPPPSSNGLTTPPAAPASANGSINGKSLPSPASTRPGTIEK